MKTIKELEKEIEKVNSEIAEADEKIAKWKNIQRKLQEKKTSLKRSIDKQKSDALASVDWAGTEYEWSHEVRNTLKTVFNINSFRAKQLTAINSTLSGQHALVVMPTGAGKSLCYQLPALIKLGLTVVICPLVSLMEDQVNSLKNKNIAACLLTSTSTKEEKTLATEALKDKNSKIKLLYVTPERLAKSKIFMANLQKCYAEGRLKRIAIDEVHCCSQWGHDFRPDYKFLGILSKMFPKTPILGLTATATAHVLNDVQKILNLQGCLVIKSTFNRPNLFYKILAKPTSQDECIEMLEKLLKHRYKNKSGIIYANNIKDCEDLASSLRKKGLKVGCYHANMEAESRSAVHMKWHNNYYQAIIATIAFGMGIDKPDVRFVIHHTISKSMENYYQESGRAGRDGQTAECVTLYRMQDIIKVSAMVFSSNTGLDHLFGMVKYCLNGQLCRRQLIAEHFDEDWGDADCNKMCDVCLKSDFSQEEVSLESYCRTLCSIIENAAKQDTKLTAQKLLDAWFLKGPVALRHGGKAPNLSRSLAEDIIAYLLVEGYLVGDFHFTAYSTVVYLKQGPNMDLMNDKDFKLNMPIRKYTSFNLETPVFTEQDLSDDELVLIEETNSKKKRKLSEEESKPKKKK